MHARRFRHAAGIAALVLLARAVAAQPANPSPAQPGSAPAGWLDQLDRAESQRLIEKHGVLAKSAEEIEKELRKLRLKHFGPVRNTQVRQEGILKLREYNTPAAYLAMGEVFEREALDVRVAIIDMLADAGTMESRSALAWISVHDPLREARQQAAEKIRAAGALDDATRAALRAVVYSALRENNKEMIARGVHLADIADIVEIIPWLITAQLQSPRSSSGSGQVRRGDLAWIFVGQQVAYISDLEPVVADAAVAFDPQISVLNEGTFIRVHDAAVSTYRVDIHNELVRFTSRKWGRSTQELGWDQGAWRSWYSDEFKPYWAARQAASHGAKPTEAAGGG
jgi:hypothetical protein